MEIGNDCATRSREQEGQEGVGVTDDAGQQQAPAKSAGRDKMLSVGLAYAGGMIAERPRAHGDAILCWRDRNGLAKNAIFPAKLECHANLSMSERF